MASVQDTRSRRRYLRVLRYPLEAAGLYAAYGILRLLPVDLASDIGGGLCRALGPRLPVSRTARRNLAIALPEKSRAEREAILRDMWENLGRTAAEYPHLGAITDPGSGRVEVVGSEHALALAESGGILASAHLANWEVMPVVAAQHGLALTVVVRAPNNPLVRPALERWRGVAGGRRIPKGRAGARAALALLEAGGTLGLLCDQRMNRGVSVPFFGHAAMTASAPAQLALKTGRPIAPARIERLGPGRFRLTCQPPLEAPRLGERKAEVRALTAEINRVIEGWVRERPGEWFWLHRRWPPELYRKDGGDDAKER